MWLSVEVMVNGGQDVTNERVSTCPGLHGWMHTATKSLTAPGPRKARVDSLDMGSSGLIRYYLPVMLSIQDYQRRLLACLRLNHNRSGVGTGCDVWSTGI